jgi:tripartite-type tricarboxylate transporter receptor subunit TctC
MGSKSASAIRILGTCAVLWSCLAPAADTYPAKPVHVIVPAGAGGGDDFVARLVASKMAEILGQQFVVENRPGAGGSIGQTQVAKSAPDGYTLLLAGGSMAGAKYVNASITYDLQRDFTPISLIETSPFALVASKTLPANNAKELVALGKSRPGRMTFATLGPGQIPYWSAVLFNSSAGFEATEVPYKTAPDAVIDVIAGRVDYNFTPVVVALTNKDKLRILAVTTSYRSEMMPEVPTLAEAAGLPGYEMPSWRGFMAPAGLNRDVLATLNAAMVRALAAPDVREKFTKAGSVPSSSTPEELRKRYEDWSVIFGKIAKGAGLKPM